LAVAFRRTGRIPNLLFWLIMYVSEILKANEDYHDQEADHYDSTQPFIRNDFAQKLFLDDIRSIIDKLSGVADPIRVLDCGAGTGNLTLKFLHHGCTVTSVDLSQNMLSRLQKKASALGKGKLDVSHSDIDSFLQTTKQRYNVVCSSSFLHHLPDYTSTYRLMTNVCAADAVIYTAFEPLQSARLNAGQRCLRSADSLSYEVITRRLYNPLVVGRAFMRRLHLLPTPENVLNQVDPSLIERPDLGIDSDTLSTILRSAGFRNIDAYWRPITRYRLTYLISKHLVHLNNALFLIARRSG
jgi:ubiquinone/menaquinone biosynthesis C-methylase UbiE